MDFFGPLVATFITLVPVLLVFLLIRALVLWYWKVNDALHMLEWQKNLLERNREQNIEIIRLLRKIAGEESPQGEQKETPSEP